MLFIYYTHKYTFLFDLFRKNIYILISIASIDILFIYIFFSMKIDMTMTLINHQMVGTKGQSLCVWACVCD